MGQWFIDDAEYLRLWAWLARAPVEEEDARCPAPGRSDGCEYEVRTRSLSWADSWWPGRPHPTAGWLMP